MRNEDTWIVKKIKTERKSLIDAHQKGILLYQEEWQQVCLHQSGCSWHNGRYPPALRKALREGTAPCITPDPSWEFYFWASGIYESLTAKKAPCHFQQGSPWKNKLIKATADWNEAERNELIKIIESCTKRRSP